MALSNRARAYASANINDTRSHYDDWAATYDLEMTEKSYDYVGPVLATSYALRALGLLNQKIDNIRILDAGCGTGLVGLELKRVGAKNIDGVDLSTGMLEIARKTGVYNNLETADLSQPLACANKTFGMVICIGTLTQGHVGPEALDEFVRVTEPGGHIVATVLGKIWETQGYKAKVEELAEQGKVQILSTESEDYLRGASVKARMVVLRVLV